ncbi:MAG: flagellar motor protein, partial [Pseudomonadota bacterium]|nr:flagellar motor protein [Pseudomonadota bacterium]
GVPAKRLAATGYGEFQPLTNGDSVADRRLNRRIELKITQRVAAK